MWLNDLRGGGSVVHGLVFEEVLFSHVHRSTHLTAEQRRSLIGSGFVFDEYLARYERLAALRLRVKTHVYLDDSLLGRHRLDFAGIEWRSQLRQHSRHACSPSIRSSRCSCRFTAGTRTGDCLAELDRISQQVVGELHATSRVDEDYLV